MKRIINNKFTVGGLTIAIAVLPGLYPSLTIRFNRRQRPSNLLLLFAALASIGLIILLWQQLSARHVRKLWKFLSLVGASFAANIGINALIHRARHQAQVTVS